MPAECYWCKTTTAPGSVPSPVGIPGEPIGCCIKCQILACGYHAIRDNLKQEFKCYACLFIKLIASALRKANLDNDDEQALVAWDGVFEIALQSKDDFYRDFNEFKIANPQLKEWFPEITNSTIDFDLWPFQIEHILRKFSNDSEKFLITAALIVSNIENTSEITEFNNLLKYYLLQIINNTMLRP
jgi:hypothetical protein